MPFEARHNSHSCSKWYKNVCLKFFPWKYFCWLMRKCVKNHRRILKISGYLLKFQQYCKTLVTQYCIQFKFILVKIVTLNPVTLSRTCDSTIVFFLWFFMFLSDFWSKCFCGHKHSRQKRNTGKSPNIALIKLVLHW